MKNIFTFFIFFQILFPNLSTQKEPSTVKTLVDNYSGKAVIVFNKKKKRLMNTIYRLHERSECGR